MKIEIDEEGHLLLERGGEMKSQFCPYQPRSLVQCGDWCPLFGEPDIFFNGSNDYFELTICHKKLKCRKDFTDRRPHNAMP